MRATTEYSKVNNMTDRNFLYCKTSILGLGIILIVCVGIYWGVKTDIKTSDSNHTSVNATEDDETHAMTDDDTIIMDDIEEKQPDMKESVPKESVPDVKEEQADKKSDESSLKSEKKESSDSSREKMLAIKTVQKAKVHKNSKAGYTKKVHSKHALPSLNHNKYKLNDRTLDEYIIGNNSEGIDTHWHVGGDQLHSKTGHMMSHDSSGIYADNLEYRKVRHELNSRSLDEYDACSKGIDTYWHVGRDQLHNEERINEISLNHSKVTTYPQNTKVQRKSDEKTIDEYIIGSTFKGINTRWHVGKDQTHVHYGIDKAVVIGKAHNSQNRIKIHHKPNKKTLNEYIIGNNSKGINTSWYVGHDQTHYKTNKLQFGKTVIYTSKALTSQSRNIMTMHHKPNEKTLNDYIIGTNYKGISSHWHLGKE